jgi:hypothetical protein
MPRDLADAPAPNEEEALDDAILLAELRYAVEGARTRAEDRLRYRPDWRARLGRIYARHVA